jgi:tetratricopeptide (TPR) repeat protein
MYEAACAASRGQWEDLNGHINDLRQIWEEYGIKPKAQEYYTALIFDYAELSDSAIAHHQLGWKMDPDDPYRIFTYGRSLIRYDKDIQTGVDLLETIPDYPGNKLLYLLALGNGYYKEGRTEEALETYLEAKEISTVAHLDLEQSIEEAREALKRKNGSGI